MITDEWGDGRYGAIFWRSENRAVWQCSDGDYSFKGVVDDFGNIICISHYTNTRGY